MAQKTTKRQRETLASAVRDYDAGKLSETKIAQIEKIYRCPIEEAISLIRDFLENRKYIIRDLGIRELRAFINAVKKNSVSDEEKHKYEQACKCDFDKIVRWAFETVWDYEEQRRSSRTMCRYDGDIIIAHASGARESPGN